MLSLGQVDRADDQFDPDPQARAAAQPHHAPLGLHSYLR